MSWFDVARTAVALFIATALVGWYYCCIFYIRDAVFQRVFWFALVCTVGFFVTHPEMLP